MFEDFGTSLSTSRFYDLFERIDNMDYEYLYGHNAPVQDYIGLLMDVMENVAALRHAEGDLHSKSSGYPAHGFVQPGITYRHGSGWEDTILQLLDNPHIASLLGQDWFLNEDGGTEEEVDLRKCIKAAKTLSKKQMMEYIPDVCRFVQSVQDTRAAFETLDEFLKEVFEQNKALGA